MHPKNINIGGSLIASALALALGSAIGGAVVPTVKRVEQKPRLHTMSNRQRALYEKSLRRTARHNKEA